MLAMNDPLSVSVTSFMGSRRSVRPGGKMIRDFLMAMVASFMRFPSLSRRLRYFFSSRVFGLAASMLLPAVVCAGPIVPDPVFSGYITWGTPTQITFINGPGFFDSGPAILYVNGAPSLDLVGPLTFRWPWFPNL